MITETRKKQLEDGSIIKQRLYTFMDGLEVWCPEKSCVFCGHCSDVFYDWHGPYGFVCDKDFETNEELVDKGCNGECEYFQDRIGSES